jgi:lysophospholipase L1-like esterase
LLAALLSGCGVGVVGSAASQGVEVAIDPPSAQGVPGARIGFAATVTGTVDTGVVWTVQEASGGSVDGSGLYTAPATTGVFHVVATSRASNSASAQAVVTIGQVPPTVGIQVAPAAATVAAGGTVQLNATVTGLTDTAVDWSVAEGATGGAVDATGRYTAPQATGTYHVVATSHADGTLQARASIFVVASSILPSPMALISRSVPVTSSGGTAKWAQDASYGGIAWGFHMADVGNTGWVTYDLSGVPAAQRRALLVALYLGKGDQYYQLNYRAATWTPEFIPDAYVLEGATSASGPWTALATEPTNANPFKSHLITDFSPYTFLRFRVTASSTGCYVKMDVYDAGAGVTDGIVFYGDSIVTNVFSAHYLGYGPEWLSKPIQAAKPAFFPFVLGGGYPFTKAIDGVHLIVAGTGSFTAGLPAPLRTIYRQAKYAALIWGANDAGADGDTAAFRSNYTQIVNALRAGGQTVVLASPTWQGPASPYAPGAAGRLALMRAAIGFFAPAWTARTYAAGEYTWSNGREYLCTTAGTSATGPTGTGSGLSDGGSARWAYVPSLREDFARDPQVIAGPDLFARFENHADWLSDGLHPNGTGDTQWRDAWVSWARDTLYAPAP